MPTASPPPRALTERDYRVGYILLLSILAAFIFIAIRLITKVLAWARTALRVVQAARSPVDAEIPCLVLVTAVDG